MDLRPKENTTKGRLMMHISEIKITPVQSENGLVGFASLVFENAFYLGSIGIFTRPSGGYRLTYPLRKNTRENINFFYHK